MSSHFRAGKVSATAVFITISIAVMMSLNLGSARADVLFEHSTGPSARSTPSQDFEVGFNNFDSETADDFVVPAGKAWRIEEVFARGLREGTEFATTANVTLYNDNSGVPGSQILNQPTTIKPDTFPRLELSIASNPVLQAGTYWLGVQAIMNGGTDASQWFWADNPNQAGSPAVFRNPGGGFLSGCPTFTARNTCTFGADPSNPEADQMFRLNGTEFSQVPDTSIDSGPADGSTIKADSTSFSFSSSDPESTFECSIEGEAFTSCTSPVSMVGLTAGSHSFAVRATNGLGTVDPTPAASQFTVEFSSVGPSTACKAAKAAKKKADAKLKKAKKQLKKAKSKKAKKSAKKKVAKAKSGAKRAGSKVESAC